MLGGSLKKAFNIIRVHLALAFSKQTRYVESALNKLEDGLRKPT
jgi:hypothetical protein